MTGPGLAVLRSVETHSCSNCFNKSSLTEVFSGGLEGEGVWLIARGVDKFTEVIMSLRVSRALSLSVSFMSSNSS